MKAKQPQNAKIILADACDWIADETHAAGFQIAKPAGVIENFSVLRGVKGVDREIAAPGVLRPILRERHGGVPAEGLHIAPQARDLERFAADNRRDRSVLDAGGMRCNPRRAQPPHDLLRLKWRGDVDVGDGKTEQRIAHGTADEPGGTVVARQRVDDRAGFARVHPVVRLRIEAAHQLSLSAKFTRMAAVAPQMTCGP